MNEKIGSNQRGYSHGFLHLSLKGDNCNVDNNSISCCRKIRSRKSLIPKDAIVFGQANDLCFGKILLQLKEKM